MKKKNFLILIIWILSIVASILWTFENPEQIEKIKSYFKKKKVIESKVINETITEVTANSFHVNFNKVLEINGKTVYEYNYGLQGFHEGSCLKENISELTDLEKQYNENYDFCKLPQEFYQSIPN